MEKAILKTLIYADIFDYPLKSYEIHKWLIGSPSTFQQLEKALVRLKVKGKIKNKQEYFFITGKEAIIKKRKLREKQSKSYFLKGKFCVWFLKLIPTLKLVGISGGLALNNAEKKDDIDLFLITSKNRIWLTRLLVITSLDLLGVRRKANMNSAQSAGKICINILIEEDRLEQKNKDLFTAHEVLQMKVLWQRENTYKKYLEKNEWVFKFLPNWIGPSTSEGDRLQSAKGGLTRADKKSNVPVLENLAKWLQLKIMKKPKGLERIEDGVLYFHPNDVRVKILKEFQQRLKNLSNT